MQTLAELQELADLAASYSAAYERSRAVSPFAAAALSLAAIDLASAAIDALYAIAAVAEQPQLLREQVPGGRLRLGQSSNGVRLSGSRLLRALPVARRRK